MKKFSTYAVFILVLNVFVVLWGAVVRAAGSGAGCGSHWPLCNGEVIPLAPEVETMIEFTHRLTSGLAVLGVIGLVILSRRTFETAHPVRRFAVLSLVFIIIESLIGAGLVLFELVGMNTSAERAVVVSIHLLNTLVLLGFLSLTWWRSRFPEDYMEQKLDDQRYRTTMLIFAVVIILVGVSGAIAALGDTLFPAQSLMEGIRQDLDEFAHFLVRLRVFHPFFAVLGAILVFSLIYRSIENDSRRLVKRLGWLVLILGTVQLLGGFVNLVLLAPVWMQIVHLFIADFLWIAFVLFIDTKRHTPIKVS